MTKSTYMLYIASIYILLSQNVVAEPIPIAALKRGAPVSFEKEILPILQRSCLACHGANDANGELVLESPQTILRGGDSGPAVVAGKSGESLMLQLAAHQDDPVMPPEGNDVSAKPLTSQELGLLKLWIDQGAKGTGLTTVLSPQQWRPLPPGQQPISAVAVSPDGQFAACGRANQIFIYHVGSGQIVTRLTDPALLDASQDKRPGISHLDIVQSLSFNSQGDMLASGGFRTAKLWRYPRNVQRFTLQTDAEIRAVAVSPDHSLAATGGADGKIRLWPLNTNDTAPSKPLLLEAHTAEIRGLCFTSDGTRVISTSADKTILVWSATEGKLVGRIDTSAELYGVTVFRQPPPDPAVEGAESIEQIVTAGADKFIRFWNLPNHLPQKLADVPAKATVLAASQDGRLLALANPAGLLRVVDSETNLPLYEWPAHAGPIHAVTFGRLLAPEPSDKKLETVETTERRMATAGEDGVVRVWSLGIVHIADKAEPTAEKVGAPEELFTLRGSLVPIRSIDFRPDSQQLVAGADDGSVTVWNLATAVEPLDATRQLDVPGTVDPPNAADNLRHLVALSPNGKLLATTSATNGHAAILVRDLSSGKLLQTLLGHSGPVVSLAFSNDNTKIASGSVDMTARVWDLASPKFPEIARFPGHTAPVTAIAFHSDAQQVLSGSADNSVKLWKTADAELVMDFVGHTAPVVAVAMAANNQPVSASADKTVRLWNPADGKAARSQTETAAVTALSTSRDGTRFAVAAADNSIKIYATTGGAAQLTLTGHQFPPSSLAFNADKTRIVSGDTKLAIVWDATDGRLLEIIPTGEAELHCVAYDAEIGQIVLADDRQRITLHSLRFLGAGKGMSKPISGVVWHPGGQSVITSCQDGTVRGFNVSNFAQAFSANHGAPVHGLAISKDGTKLASAGENKIVRIWNPANGAALQPSQLTGFAGPVRCVDFSDDGQRLIAGSIDGNLGQLTVFHLTAPAGVIEQSIVGHTSPLTACRAFTAGGQAVSLSDDGVVLRWELLATQRIAGHSQAVTSVVSIPLRDGQPPQILSGSLDGSVRRWNALTGQVLGQLNHGAPVTSVAVRDDGQRWASASSNNTIRLWNATNNAQVAQMSGDLRAKSLVAKLTQQKNDTTAKVSRAKVLLTAVEKALPLKTTAEKTAATAMEVANKDVEAKSAVLTTASTKKASAEKLAIEAAAAAQLAARKMAAANDLATQLSAKSIATAARAARPRAVASANPENKVLAKLAEDAAAKAQTADAEAKAAEAAKASPAAEATKTAQLAATAATAAIALNKPFTDADTALAASQATQRSAKQAHEIAVRDLELATADVPAAKQALANVEALLKKVDGEVTAAIAADKSAQQPIQSIAFSPDNGTLASGGDFGAIHTWNAETGAALSSYVGHTGAISVVVYLDNDTIISSAADKTAVAWNLNPSWQLERVIGDIRDPSILIDRVASVDFSSDGKLLATAGGVPSRSGEVKIWNVADGSLVHSMPEAHTDAVAAVAFSPDDLFFATASADKYLKKFETATGKQVGQFEGHTNYAMGVTWRGGGKILASCGADGTIRIWNADTADRIRIIQGFNKQVSAIRFIGETQFAVVVTGEAQVRKYNMDNGGVQTNYSGPTDFMFAVDATGDPNNGVVVAGGYDGQLRIWRANGPVIQTIGPPELPTDELAVAAGETTKSGK